MAQAETKAPREAGSRHNDDMFVVGIGASAGGLEALQQFFRFMPSGSGLSFVVIQHLAPDYKSLMADILGKYTQMPVLQAEDGMAVEENTVYLIPPKKNITYHSGRLFLRDYVQGTLNHPSTSSSIPWRRRKRNTPSPWSSPAPARTAPAASRPPRKRAA